jgi:hypothetical protein
MSRVNFAVEQGYEIYALNGNLLVAQLAGSAAPGGDAGVQDDAPIGSIYQRSNGELYVKTADTNAASDWDLVPVQLSAGYAPANGDPTIGDSFEEAIEKLDGNQDDIQTSLGIAQGDVDFGTFTGAIIEDNQTAKAALQDLEDSMGNLVTLSGVALDSTDLGTFTGVTIPDSSTIKGALQSLETAYEETDANVDDLITLSGVAENATDLGTFTGAIIPDSSTIKGALQSIETYIETLEFGVAFTGSGVTTAVTADSVLVDDVHSVEWEMVVWEEATPANKIFQKITALHDGTASADASNVDDVAHTKLKLGSNFDLDVSVDLNGAGGAQEMRLRIASGTAGIAYEVRRTGVLVNN